MPLIVMTSWGRRPSSTSACFRAASTPKSPQPGHQSGSTFPFRSLTVTSGRAAKLSEAPVSSAPGMTTLIYFPSLHHDLVDWHVRFSRPGQDRLHARHDVVRHERL